MKLVMTKDSINGIKTSPTANELIENTPTRNLSCKVDTLKCEFKPLPTKAQALKSIRESNGTN